MPASLSNFTSDGVLQNFKLQSAIWKMVFIQYEVIFFATASQGVRDLDDVGGLVDSHDPDSNTDGSVTKGRPTLARQVKGRSQTKEQSTKWVM
jgi:hypothetical protein